MFFFYFRDPAMKCFHCGYLKTIVLDSRGKENFSKVMRKRWCPQCRKRMTTFEVTDEDRRIESLSVSTLIELYEKIINQMKLLEESIKLINPNKFI